jgi:rsbT co-antagonist protein RsbR
MVEQVEQQQEIIEEQRRTIEELETPVIQVWDRVLLLPIVGSLDTARAQKMNESLLDQIVETRSDVVVLDLTGVALVDTAVARHLAETVAAARLLGADVTIVGVSGRVALTMVQLGIDFSGLGITTRATLARGLEAAFHKLGLEVVPRRAMTEAAAAYARNGGREE